MGHYASPTPKRHLAYSNSSTIRKLDLGQLVGWTKQAKADEQSGKDRVKTVKKYVDKNGKCRFHGVAALKHSESETHFLVGYWFTMKSTDLIRNAA